MTRKQAQMMDLELREQAASLEEEWQSQDNSCFFVDCEEGTKVYFKNDRDGLDPFQNGETL